ncbi:Y-family DNA polymerase [Vallitalea sp.]|jgi:DNA polymerase-4|uniref:Y-family DNA polymerase n=1 Tax=Vallitalea sp. TaxID=1882829 RepID=UPI0025F68F6B|nr:DNA polymerase IV [Vallitalea sp.]MCT4687918.1 DNA polymerase IV [Vallitalea sp.]
MNKFILHIDVNSAYLSWIAARRVSNGDPVDLREIAAVVGGSEKSRHGITLAKSRICSKMGVKTGEPLMTVRQKCPDVTIVPPDYNLFARASQSMYELICEYSDVVQRFSVDECFTQIYINGGRDEIIKIAHKIKDRIYRELGFTVNVGISVNKILSKMASNFKKPDRVHTLWPEEVPQKMWSLPIRSLFMVGRKTEKKLLNLGIYTIGNLANANINTLESHLKSYAYLIQTYAQGCDDSPVRLSNRTVIKGIGNGTTSCFDVKTRHDAHLYILSLTESVASRLRAAGYCAGLVAVGTTSTKFISQSRQKKLNVAVDSTTYICKIATELFNELWDGEPIRKFRVRVSNLHENDYVQLSLLEEFDFEKHKKIDNAVDDIRNRFGSNAIQRASFLHSGIKSGAGGVGDDDDYPLMTSIL